MDAGFNRHRYINELEDSENLPENSGRDSPRSAVSADAKIASTSSYKRSRRGIQKRVVSVRVNKGDQMTAPPPSDSWTWRKYGQKPIKGSPYPRGYYRCSSSKGCPARKQVERSRLDPEMLLVTYYSEHNHNWPSSKTHHHKNGDGAAVMAARNVKTPLSEEEEKEEEEEDGEEVEEEEEEEEEEKPRSFVSNETNEDEPVPENKFSSNICEPPAINNVEFGWFSEFDPTSFTMLESPMLAEDRINTDSEMAMVFTMGKEDESLFADLGELPECSTVFRSGLVPGEAEQRLPTMMT